MKTLLLLLGSVVAFAQQQGAYPWVYQIQNATSTGTTQFKLAKLNSSGQAVIAATTDTAGIIGVCVTNCGTSGSALIAYAGLVPLIMDGTATVQHYVQISSGTGGDGADTGSATYPTSGGQVIAQVQQACTGAACTAMALLSIQTQANTAGASGAISVQSTNLGNNTGSPSGTGARVIGTIYHNTNSYPLFVVVECSSSTGVLIQAASDTNTTPVQIVASNGNNGSAVTWTNISFWVLPSNYYSVSATVGSCNGAGANGTYWTEWH